MNVQRMVGQALGLGLMMILTVLVLSACGGGGGKAGNAVSREGDEVDRIRDIERQRVRALVEADMDVARRLHADDFQLITPFGDSLSKGEYLGSVESGDIDYVLHARVPDVAAYDALYQKIISRVTLSDVSASFVMEEMKGSTELPLTFL